MLSISDLKKDNREPKEIYVDLNCDLAQSFGVYKNDTELDLLPYVSSVNIACGLHAGDPLTILKAFKTTIKNNLAIGAHIGYPDIQGFGYRAMQLDDEELQAMVIYQIGAISAMAKSLNVKIDHIRPHGALYVQAAKDFRVMLNIAKGIAKVDPWLILTAASGSHLEKAADAAGIKFAGEVHLDKIYNADGTINFNANEKIDIEYSKNMLDSLIEKSCVVNAEGGMTKVEFATIHLHSKTDISLDIAKMAFEKIQKPSPISVNIIKDSSWLK